MSAKAVVQTQKMHRLYRPLREQAKRCPVRSHQSSWIPVGANLFAKAVVQAQKMHRLYRPLREQAKRRPVRTKARGYL
ncbi:hypothetical protein BKM03_26035 [Pseudomonas avellanae]|uniref:Uncharacterized protein n=1 Tax=Pseudomonas avellanae TaxID=46257 RepID=A0AAD0M4R7_9PSED|nr:hypothetical protein BKM03_26035 [Pseudomonas avellanae]POP88265.1 hypothetical protein CXB34_03370 [Pseudomonas amygdali pv. morsprunorum]